MKVLFLGRKHCEGSSFLVNRLSDAGQEVTSFFSSHRGQAMDDWISEWTGDLIISYRNLILVPKEILERASLAVNFHPGPPEYPGSGCTNFALLDDAKTFGVTCHVMDPSIDSGRILEVRRFQITPSMNIQELVKRTHEELLSLAQDYVSRVIVTTPNQIATLAKAQTNEVWSGSKGTISKLDSLQRVDLSLSQDELERRIRALHNPPHPVYLEVFGHRFELVKND